MSKPSPQKLDESLKAYRVYIEHFHEGSGDTFVAFGEREFLQSALPLLTPRQRQAMSDTDAMVLALAEAPHNDEDDDDVRVLIMTADIINAGGQQKSRLNDKPLSPVRGEMFVNGKTLSPVRGEMFVKQR